MNESQLKAKMRTYLNKTYPAAVVYRHEDKFTAGIPDLSITQNGQTIWIEVKIHNAEIFSCVDFIHKFPLQAREIQRLGGYFVVWTPKRHNPYSLIARERNIGWSELCCAAAFEGILEYAVRINASRIIRASVL